MSSPLRIPNDSLVKGIHGNYLISQQLGPSLWRAVDTQTNQKVIVKSAPVSRLRKERDNLRRFQDVAPLRRLIEVIGNPLLLILEYLDSEILSESGKEESLESADVKRVAKTVLEALAVMHEEGIVHTDVRPDNILVNHGKGGHRFGDIKLADSGDSTHIVFAVEEHVIGSALFRSPEAILHQIWGPPTDIWSLGATLIGLIFGDWIIFKPDGVDVIDPAYSTEVLRRQVVLFGPPPLSYGTFGDNYALGTLIRIMDSLSGYLPFKIATSKWIGREDRTFICKLMKLDPRDRPSAKELLQDEWFIE